MLNILEKYEFVMLCSWASATDLGCFCLCNDWSLLFEDMNYHILNEHCIIPLMFVTDVCHNQQCSYIVSSKDKQISLFSEMTDECFVLPLTKVSLIYLWNLCMNYWDLTSNTHHTLYILGKF